MDILARLLYYILLFFVRIGDAVLFCFSLLHVIVNYVIDFPSKLKKRKKGPRKLRLPKLTYTKFRLRPKRRGRPKKLKKKADIFVLTTNKARLTLAIYCTLFILFFIALPLTSYIFIQSLPRPESLTERQIPQTTKIYDRNGVLLQQIYSQQNRTMIPLEKIPASLKYATIAIEDKNFYKHPGFDITAIIRALKENLTGGSFQGGSTITQQLIKSSLLSNEITLERKVKEIVLAAWAERIYDKDEILEMYFNQIPYGSTAWGAQAAAELYFGKNVEDLNLAESSFLAGIAAAPTTFSPFSNDSGLWKNRQNEVLTKMVQYGYISQNQADDALRTELAFQKLDTPLRAPHFVEYVKDLLARRYGLAMVERGGLNVRTSLDLELQKKAEEIVSQEVEKNAYLNLHNGAAVITDAENGDVLAMVGSRDYAAPEFGNVNIATSLQQPGSSIKVVTYAAALSNGFTAASTLEDTPVTYKSQGSEDYSPVNYDGRFRGRVPLRLALANSLNIPAVKMLNSIGVDKMITYGRSMGIDTWTDPTRYGLAITLGSAEVTMLDMAEVYGTLANEGQLTELNPILEVKDYKNNIYEKKEVSETKQVLNPGVAFIISDILADNQARSSSFGTSSPLYIPGYTVSVKTGTTDDKRDNWTIGYAGEKVVVVWVGNNDNSAMSRSLASGITGAAPIWNKIMTLVLTGKENKAKDIPQDIVVRQCFGRQEYFLKGTENGVNCSNFRPLSSSNQSGAN